MKYASILCVVAWVVVGLGAWTARAVLIDFETVPGDTAADNMAISTQYSAPNHGNVSFYFDADRDGNTDGPMYLEARDGSDDEPQGYQNDTLSSSTSKVKDIENAGSHGNFLLRSPSNIGDRTPSALIIRYTNPTTAFSGEIWDIDGLPAAGSERWRVEVYEQIHDASSFIDSFESPNGLSNNLNDDPNSLDGKPWLFQYQAPNDVTVSEIRIVFSGTKTENIGLAFDNFNSTQIPEPASLVLFGVGAALMMRRR